MTPVNRVIAVALAGLVMHVPAARAQNAGAEALFREGRDMIKHGNLAGGCDKLEASEKLESSVGTLLNLGDCREKLGRQASAWAAFRKAEALAKRNGNDAKREREARRRALALEDDLASVTVQVGPKAKSGGLVIKRDGELVDPDRVRTTVGMVQTTSPSVLILASIDATRRQMALAGEDLLERTIALASDARRRLQALPGIAVLDAERLGGAELDVTKLVVDVDGLGITGYAVEDALRHRFGIGPEMSDLVGLVEVEHGQGTIDLLIGGDCHNGRVVWPGRQLPKAWQDYFNFRDAGLAKTFDQHKVARRHPLEQAFEGWFGILRVFVHEHPSLVANQTDFLSACLPYPI